jgi:adenylate cyclase class 2
MAFEIEVKAHADDPLRLKERLDALGEYACAFEKDDTYWVLSKPGARLSPNTGEIPGSGVRVRQEQNTGASGRETGRVLVTCKVKEVREGIEVNDEREFTVSNGDTFGELLKRLGLAKGLRKHKRGWAWTCGSICAELCEVSGGAEGSSRSLGWFIELEILADDAGPETVAAARKKLLGLLGRLNVADGCIEERYYSEMLGES